MNAPPPDTADLRTRALALLDALPDGRARAALDGANVSIEPDIARWESSGGTVHAHRVVVSLDARALGQIHGVPAVADDLHTAFARAIAALPNASLHDLAFVWNGSLAARVVSYRGSAAIDGRAELTEAVAEYLDGAGERDAARLTRSTVVRLRGPDDVEFRGSPGGFTATAQRDAVRALLGARTRVTWR